MKARQMSIKRKTSIHKTEKPKTKVTYLGPILAEAEQERIVTQIFDDN